MATLLHLLLCGLLAVTFPAMAQSMSDWSSKAKFGIDTSPAGANLRTALQQFVVPVRLHTGNFDFKAAKPDGSDLRFVAADGKTVLPHQLESWDAANEIAVAWVQVPSIAPGTKDQFVWVHAGNPKAEAPADAKLYDARTPVVVRFTGALRNEGGGQAQLAASGAGVEPVGVAGAAAKLAAGGTITASGPDVKLGADGTTVSAWVRGAGPGAAGALLSLVGERARIDVTLASGVPSLRVAQAGTGGAAQAPASASAGAPLAGDRWQLMSVVVGTDRVVLFVDGQEAASVPAKLGEQPIRTTVGGGAAIDVDELVVSTVARVPEYVRATFASQGPDNSMIALVEESGHNEATYLKILIDNLTIDGKIVIYLLGVMFVVALWVIVAKTIMVSRVARANAAFMKAFDSAGADAFLAPSFGGASVGAATSGAPARFAQSSLYRMFETAAAEIGRRASGTEAAPQLGDKAINSIRAAVDATSVRENARLNRFIVLLTIAISGGPFIGLLGTVVGVMITFAAIAAIGDVNINAIAPGIAAALLATVAGLAVAIPALFAYNWLASRIKELTSEMQIFGDQLMSRIAEAFQR
jgi:biopolymer transport protein ExbB